MARIYTDSCLLTQLAPPISGPPRLLLGHLVPFVSRLRFVLIGEFFAVAFRIHYPTLGLDLARKLVALLVVFTVFCVSKETDRLGVALITPTTPSPRAPRGSRRTVRTWTAPSATLPPSGTARA
jgi:hypothetical protein